MTFTDQSSNAPDAWNWDFDGDGLADSAAQNPQHVYTSPGLYSVRLEAGNAAGVNEASKAARATEAGCHVYREDKLVTHDGRVGREVGFVDYDGNLTVIYHIPEA